MYRHLRAIDVAMTAAAITADLTPPDKKIMAAREGLLAERTEDGPLLVKATASRAVWVRHENPLVQRCGRGARSAAGRCAHVLLSVERRARAPPLPQGDLEKDRLATPVPSEPSRAEGNST